MFWCSRHPDTEEIAEVDSKSESGGKNNFKLESEPKEVDSMFESEAEEFDKKEESNDLKMKSDGEEGGIRRNATTVENV